MIGIYKITNKVNGHSYVGQSSNIQRRWQNHKVAAYNLMIRDMNIRFIEQ